MYSETIKNYNLRTIVSKEKENDKWIGLYTQHFWLCKVWMVTLLMSIKNCSIHSRGPSKICHNGVIMLASHQQENVTLVAWCTVLTPYNKYACTFYRLSSTEVLKVSTYIILGGFHPKDYDTK